MVPVIIKGKTQCQELNGGNSKERKKLRRKLQNQVIIRHAKIK